MTVRTIVVPESTYSLALPEARYVYTLWTVHQVDLSDSCAAVYGLMLPLNQHISLDLAIDTAF